MNGSSLGKYSGSAQYNSPENWAAAGNNTTSAGASAAHEGWRLHQQLSGVYQGRRNKLSV